MRVHKLIYPACRVHAVMHCDDQDSHGRELIVAMCMSGRPLRSIVRQLNECPRYRLCTCNAVDVSETAEKAVKPVLRRVYHHRPRILERVIRAGRSARSNAVSGPEGHYLLTAFELRSGSHRRKQQCSGTLPPFTAVFATPSKTMVRLQAPLTRAGGSLHPECPGPSTVGFQDVHSIRRAENPCS